MIQYNKTVLESGIKVISEYIPTALSTIIGLNITIGSRNEDKNNMGICHFIEHSVFKGTKKRDEREISIAIESRGGELNASTSREWTSFYAHVLPEELSLAVDILSDLIANPLFDEDAIEKERHVIQQEIRGFYDSPDCLLFYYVLGSTFGENHPLSSPILGTLESLNKITVVDIKDYWQNNYTTDRMCVSAVGRVNHRELCEQLNKNFENRKGGRFKRKSARIKPKRFNIISKPELNHEYITLSASCFPYNDEERFPFLVALSILGMGMSSRLFQKLRQEMGLVYEVSAFNEFFSDTGIFGIYLATDENKVAKSLDAIRDLLNGLTFTKEGVEVAKERIKGNIVISLEDNSNRMIRNLREEMYLGKRIGVNELIERIDKVKFKDVVEMKDRFLKPDIFDITLLGRSKDVSW
ncbi:insulinase family protein [candidate division WOR-3 bacterium]|nr:insulinase family protein [candidate division WOR-3 bacterium]MCK4528384.1 insulinase family protein [candidate division WOR-3 bacterium]